jgi:hypothetical protein
MKRATVMVLALWCASCLGARAPHELGVDQPDSGAPLPPLPTHPASDDERPRAPVDPLSLPQIVNSSVFVPSPNSASIVQLSLTPSGGVIGPCVRSAPERFRYLSGFSKRVLAFGGAQLSACTYDATDLESEAGAAKCPMGPERKCGNGVVGGANAVTALPGPELEAALYASVDHGHGDRTVNILREAASELEVHPVDVGAAVIDVVAKGDRWIAHTEAGFAVFAAPYEAGAVATLIELEDSAGYTRLSGTSSDCLMALARDGSHVVTASLSEEAPLFQPIDIDAGSETADEDGGVGGAAGVAPRPDGAWVLAGDALFELTFTEVCALSQPRLIAQDDELARMRSVLACGEVVALSNEQEIMVHDTKDHRASVAFDQRIRNVSCVADRWLVLGFWNSETVPVGYAVFDVALNQLLEASGEVAQSAEIDGVLLIASRTPARNELRSIGTRRVIALGAAPLGIDSVAVGEVRRYVVPQLSAAGRITFAAEDLKSEQTVINFDLAGIVREKVATP